MMTRHEDIRMERRLSHKTKMAYSASRIFYFCDCTTNVANSLWQLDTILDISIYQSKRL
jgi:hypothetical protein